MVRGSDGKCHPKQIKDLSELYLLILFAIPCVGISWMVDRSRQMLVINLFCLIFMAYLDVLSLIILFLSASISHYLLNNITPVKKGVWIVVTALTILFVFFKLRSNVSENMMTVALPLGMSFYIFRQLHYAIEVYKGEMVNIDFWSYLSYLFYLPVILIGPINRLPEWRRELSRRRWNSEMFSQGLERILYGLVKITVIGNYFFSHKLDSIIRTLDEGDSWLINYLDCLRYAGNSYMQFAGYSDVAIGISLLLGIRIAENFNYPFLAHNINDFWKRWHISLSEWCKDYIWLPIASASRRAWLAILVSMLILGLWHEFSTRYILWGLFHGLGIVVWHIFDRYFKISLNAVWAKIWHIVSILITLNFVIVSFVWIKEDSFDKSLQIFMLLLGF